jgi:protein-S-isoprenylcysteine O-methyltransferase Ste14
MTDRPPLRAILGTLIFVPLVPGTVVGLVPYLLSGWRLAPPLFDRVASRVLGAAIFLLALPVFVNFLMRFVREGHGTPAPMAPPERLVVGGAFQRVRNPAYVAVISMVVGQGLFFASAPILLYAALLAIAFHLFVVLYEEPTLRRQFGAEYEAYCRRVPRWIPRIRAAR